MCWRYCSGSIPCMALDAACPNCCGGADPTIWFQSLGLIGWPPETPVKLFNKELISIGCLLFFLNIPGGMVFGGPRFPGNLSAGWPSAHAATLCWVARY